MRAVKIGGPKELKKEVQNAFEQLSSGISTDIKIAVQQKNLT